VYFLFFWITMRQ